MESIRSWLALILTVTTCVAVFVPDKYINAAELTALEKLTMMALIFYFTKKREDNNVQVPKKDIL